MISKCNTDGSNLIKQDFTVEVEVTRDLMNWKLYTYLIEYDPNYFPSQEYKSKRCRKISA